jgi:hypothetical protein
MWGKANSLRGESKVVLRALWSAAACCRFPRARVCSRAFGRVWISGQQAGLKKSGSKLPHSKAGLIGYNHLMYFDSSEKA